MNTIINMWTNWSSLEKIQEASLLLGIFLISILAIHYIAKNKSITLLTIIGFALAGLLNILGLMIIGSMFTITITEVFRIVPLLTSILLISNLGILVGFYINRKHKKGFEISKIRTEYFADTVKQTIILLLLGSSIFLFLTPQTQAILVVCILSCVGSIWSIYWVSKYLRK